MNMLYRYDETNENLVIEVMEYFREYNHDKSVEKFLKNYHGKNINPNIGDYVLYICSRLQEERVFHSIPIDLINPVRNNYKWIVSDKSFNWTKDGDGKQHTHLFNATVFGFEYVYKLYKNLVYPIVTKGINGQLGIGTGFAYGSGIVTAKHCLVDPLYVSIVGFSKDELNAAQIYVDVDDKCDLAYIELNRHLSYSYSSDPLDLEEVLVMGYPKLPQFVDFQTAEVAIASHVKPSIGSVASFAYNYISKENLILITAKIKGGNSGSPVINKYGVIKGVAVRDPKYDDAGDYDNLGYGIAYPITRVDKIYEEKNILKAKVNFLDSREIEY